MEPSTVTAYIAAQNASKPIPPPLKRTNAIRGSTRSSRGRDAAMNKLTGGHLSSRPLVYESESISTPTKSTSARLVSIPEDAFAQYEYPPQFPDPAVTPVDEVFDRIPTADELVELMFAME